MSWLGSLASGIPGSQRIWHLQFVYDNYHPHGEDYGGSINLDGFNREDWLIIAKGLGALLLLAGLIWIVVIFYKWIAFGF